MRGLSHVIYLVATAASAASAAASSTGPPQPSDVIDLGYAKYRGSLNTTTNVTNFLGIRYAKAPTGDLRWKAPQLPPNVAGIQDAKTQPNMCPQANFGSASSSPVLNHTLTASTNSTVITRSSGSIVGRQVTSTETEDCLFLNVHVPGNLQAGPKKQLPVVVWIHGGGYIAGDAQTYNGGDLIQESNSGLIVVVIQYRLGIFGFLAGSEVAKKGSLNAGLLDQEFALKWVQDHIGRFGGDPGKVTIWGESAGGGSVLQHLISRGGQAPPSGKLFRAGITSSCFLPSQYAYNDPIPEGLYKQAVAQAGCSAKPDILACLRSTDSSTLSQINVALNAAGFFGTYSTVPVVDGVFIKEAPGQALKKGLTKGSAVLSVTNADEGLIFVDPNTNYTASEYAKQLFPKLTTKDTQAIGKAYAGFGTKAEQSAGIMTEAIFLCPSLSLQNSFSQSNKPSWKGLFTIPPAIHVQDVFYYFRSVSFPALPDLGPIFTTDSFADSFAKSFFDFIISLDPNIKIDNTVKTPFWPVYGSKTGHPKEMMFRQKEVGGVERADIRVEDVDSGVLERCKLWASLADKIGQ